MSHDDFAFEPVRGLPERLPSGERILWRGVPDWRSLARRAFHVRGLTLYFLLLLVWQAGTALGNGAALAEVAVTTGWLGGVSLAALGLLALLAWLYARTTVYTITQRRAVIRFGIAIPITVNVPFTMVEAAAVKLYRDGSGDLPLRLKLGERMSYLVMWPCVRPWHFGRPEPMLRGVANAQRVADILATALEQHADAATRATPSEGGVARSDTESRPLATAAR